MALAAQVMGCKVQLWGRNPERVKQTQALGLSASTDLEEVLDGAELVILAVPVGVMKDLVEQVIPHLSKGALVTDVGSVKALPHEQVGNFLKEQDFDFIGSHPMAGSEQTGVEAATAELFQGAACVLTNQQQVDEARLHELQKFWQDLGCSEILEMTAEGHDRAVARISHFPHAMAVLTADAALKFLGDAQLAGGGFRDTSRVASGDPDMWAEIMIENRSALSDALRDAQNSLSELLVMLENSDEEELRNYLSVIKKQRDTVK